MIMATGAGIPWFLSRIQKDGWKYRDVPLQGKERGKHDLVLVKTGKPCNKSHAKENPSAGSTAGQTVHETGP
jgi:hypothetical protein